MFVSHNVIKLEINGRKRFGKLFKGHLFSSGMIKGRQQKIKDVSEGNVKGLGI